MLTLFAFTPVRRVALAFASAGIAPAVLAAAVDADTNVTLGLATSRREAFRDLLDDGLASQGDRICVAVYAALALAAVGFLVAVAVSALG